jgi:hypothetical protein|tara:strand:- start:221 stop:628 length:408 start_codon:yes stop_codon:yes gene_type:complete
MDKKQLDKTLFIEAIEIIKSKSLKSEEEMFSRNVERYQTAINSYDIIGCAKIINELKIYFDGTLDHKIELENNTNVLVVATKCFLEAIRNIAQFDSYHSGNKKHLENAEDLLKVLNISKDIININNHKHLFEGLE